MQYFLIYESSERQCKIIRPEGKFWDFATDQEKAIQQLHTLAIPDCVEFIACKPELIPTDLTFRDAWYVGDKTEPIKINFQKSIEIHRSRLKQACDLKIDQLTKQMAIAFEKSNLPEAVAIGRTTSILRTLHEMDLTHCKTVEDIKYAIPKELHDVWSFYPPKRPTT